MVAPDCETLNKPAVPAGLSVSPITPTPLPVGEEAVPCTPTPLLPLA
jgi:hypothetical protein